MKGFACGLLLAKYCTTLMSCPHLPPELWYKVCSHLSPSTLSISGATCRYLYNIARANLLWMPLVKQRYKKSEIMEVLPKVWTTQKQWDWRLLFHLAAPKPPKLPPHLLHPDYDNIATITRVHSETLFSGVTYKGEKKKFFLKINKITRSKDIRKAARRKKGKEIATVRSGSVVTFCPRVGRSQKGHCDILYVYTLAEASFLLFKREEAVRESETMDEKIDNL
mmetsp:Transcript_21744/g.24274  ORF Transcript_21744/g.24274 Transcript_21744/m.24274 type:complete len:223 (-) Transcript_21744:136-804(-)